ncbi:MAG TPA: nucleotide sugar dehydrogenase [Baekduia sp.]|nr:nucleotide sugar dehydrogenase [Baekduia sp.]
MISRAVVPAPSVAGPAVASGGTVAVVGLGYVGLPTALAFAAAGTRVLGVDVSPRRLAEIATGDVDLLATDRARLATHRSAELTCGSDPSVLAEAEAVIVCVPTPTDDRRRPDLGPLRAACETVLTHVVPGQLIVLTSTTYVGCTRELLVEPLRRRGLVVGEDVFVAFAPERIDPGNERHPQERVPRVVGGATAACAQRAAQALGVVAPVHRVTSPEAAELTKLHENTFRAVNIALAYELADIARSHGLDVAEVVDAAASKPFGFLPFSPGPGVGGHCIPCDPHYLLHPLAARGVEAPLVAAAMRAIDARPERMVHRALEAVTSTAPDRRAPRILIVGVAYKSGVADIRESPGIEILNGLRERGANVAYHDPLVPTVALGDGETTLTSAAPTAAEHDLIVIACVHPGTVPFWLDGTTPVLDCTYRHIAPSDPRRVSV